MISTRRPLAQVSELRPWRFAALLMAATLLLTACATAPRGEASPQSSASAAPIGFSPLVRSLGVEGRVAGREAAENIARLRASVTDGGFDILAISGGGSSGAYSAGVLTGLSRGGMRPRYEVVTGVSAGALIAPFAFLGPDWDPQLTEAFVGGRSQELLQSRGLGALFKPGLNSGKPLRELVDHFITGDLVAAVAEEARSGRVLLVATTDLDRQETVLWDMGSIAQRGGAEALTLFRDVLVASASVPGLFPPVMIHVGSQAGSYDEMHVDGGVTTPFFIAPEITLLSPGQLTDLRSANVYVLINAQLRESPRTTPQATIPIVARSFSTLMLHMTRAAIAGTSAFAARQDMNFHLAAIPAEYLDQGWLDFDPARMQALFDLGEARAASGQLWRSAEQELARSAGGD
ncbi:patatin-like phospholipase family protein [Phenylobacterium sp.]|uniref:patatin-like phospholipase family protein n=1 Tax=Phenylobacterium sp. TaxID=1871053 RepID=UPI002717F7B2|nr:patatin-like phospholipase family protein [Phenylobacterium sp.]MDO8378770.1 patatin-like phospholipase family protein [Phenylobacterium sp.]